MNTAPQVGMYVTAQSKKDAERHTRRVMSIPDHHGLGWTPYRYTVTTPSLPVTAFHSVKELKKWLGKEFTVKLRGEKPCRVSQILLPSSQVFPTPKPEEQAAKAMQTCPLCGK